MSGPLPDLHKARCEHLQKSTIPLLVEEDVGTTIGMGMQGHGTLFTFKGRYFIITAKHVLDDVKDWNSVGIPEKPDPGRSKLWPHLYERADVLTLQNAILYPPVAKNDGLDIGIIEILDMALIEKLRKNYTIHNESSLMTRSDKYERLVALATPTQTAARNQSLTLISPRPLYVETILMIPPPVRDPNSTVIPSSFDHHLQFGSKVFNPKGEEEPSPDLGGISGCGIWAALPDSDVTLWPPKLKLYLIDTSFVDGKYITGQHISALVPIFQKIDQEISTIIDRAIRGESR